MDQNSRLFIRVALYSLLFTYHYLYKNTRIDQRARQIPSVDDQLSIPGIYNRNGLLVHSFMGQKNTYNPEKSRQASKEIANLTESNYKRQKETTGTTRKR